MFVATYINGYIYDFATQCKIPHNQPVAGVIICTNLYILTHHVKILDNINLHIILLFTCISFLTKRLSKL